MVIAENRSGASIKLNDLSALLLRSDVRVAAYGIVFQTRVTNQTEVWTDQLISSRKHKTRWQKLVAEVVRQRARDHTIRVGYDALTDVAAVIVGQSNVE